MNGDPLCSKLQRIEESQRSAQRIDFTVMALEQRAHTLALEFLKVSSQFRLGELPTEMPHLKTINLSEDAKFNLNVAIQNIQSIDLDAFKQLQNYLPKLESLKKDIRQTLTSGGRVFLCGCGATGRLSLALETIWRYQHRDVFSDRIVSFMAGGDVALIQSIEKFEDFPEYGERQLKDLGFDKNDLLVSCSEGGETPFVIGATVAASRISERAPYFLYCNPDDILSRTAERSKRIIEDPLIRKINLTVGPMALTGSTRMQATTILMYAVGLCLWFYDAHFADLKNELQRVIDFLEKNNFDFLKPFIETESELYSNNEYLFYEADGDLGISILTDTTERSPTFSLYPFENQNDKIKNPSLSYLLFSREPDSASAWEKLLGRKPRTFHWREVTDETNYDRLVGFDFSRKIEQLRLKYLKAAHAHFKIQFEAKTNSFLFQLKGVTHSLYLKDLNFLSAHLILKICLNNLSTLVMGRLGRYESNLMTWVRASNNKLVDRAVRYAALMLERKGVVVSYEDLVFACFRNAEKLPKDQSLVLSLVGEFAKVPGSFS